MTPESSFRVFVSAATGELASYRQEVARVLLRRGIDVRDQEHFRQGGTTLLEDLNAYIEACDAIICLIGNQCGALPTTLHMAVMGDNEWGLDLRKVSGQQQISYTQWELVLAKSHNKLIYPFLTAEGFIPDNPVRESEEQRALQAAYREWVIDLGLSRSALTTNTQLIEDVLVLEFPDLLKRRPNNLPLTSIGSLFKGRDQFLIDLHQQLQHDVAGTTAITHKVESHKAKAVHGAGGIGKTRAAIEYAWRYITKYSAVLFLPAQSTDLLQAGLAGLTAVLPLTEYNDGPDEKRLQAVLYWLQTHPDWLLILDNVDTDEAAIAVKRLLPQLATGHVLITSRLSRWSAGIKTLNLGVLALDDAAVYLLEATDDNRVHTDQDQSAAEQIARKIGQLALGLEHAAAYINARDFSFDDYLAQWVHNESSVLETFDLDLIEYPHELLVTWTLSVNQLDEVAKEVLNMLSWLSPEPIPDTFFQAAPDETHLLMRDSMSALRKYSLATHIQEGNNRGFQLHRLVQSTTRYHQLQDDGATLPALDMALTWVMSACQENPADMRNWPQLEPLAAHVEEVCDFAEAHQKIGEDFPTARLLNYLAYFYLYKARYSAAEPLMRRALTIDERSYGKDHPNVAIALNNLATLLQATNRMSEAEPLIRRALTIDERSYGEDHPNVARDLNTLAQLLKATNRMSEAEPLMRRALTIDEQSSGEDHPSLAIRLNNLANLLQATNRLSEAEPLMRRALAIDERSYGEGHPDVARDLLNLASLLQARNRLSEAEPLMRRALEITEGSLGEDHPQNAAALNNLAQLLQATNRMSEAEPLMRRALTIDERSYGEDHPNVARALNNLALLLQATNRLSEVEPLMRRALTIDERSYGEDHPSLANRLNNLATFLQATNRMSEAEPLMRRAVEILRDFGTATGHEHPHLIVVMENYELLLVKTGLSNDQAYERTQEIFQ